ncbi:NADH:flavin oxidoreductase/NADH oxidase [Mycena albidolilacea]|uniref:NADH:flavin oxidoreductase/NADH oxidase n=1 Tax=Mycena albidolilacea TaxID=1033008 RepID=A0AAD6Z889_9AGAR|nr:NADH:flavin oxidoreductase/NADH oxidase [Mycena albidolilacea]
MLVQCRAVCHWNPVEVVLASVGSRCRMMPASAVSTAAYITARNARGHAHAPGIWSRDQIAAWKETTEAVHAKGSFISSQPVALGRAANPPQLLEEDSSLPYISASDGQLTGKDTVPRLLTIPEIKEYIEISAQAAKNAIETGFDGVEIHGANGYLVHQFVHDDIEYRAQFVLEVVDAVVAAVGAEKTVIRFSPWNHFQVVLTPSVQTWRCATPLPTFTYVVSQLAAHHPGLAYLHLVDPRISNDPLCAPWAPRPLLRAGGFTRNDALEAAASGDLIAFVRWFTSNPDLPTRIEKDIPFAPYDRSTF